MINHRPPPAFQGEAPYAIAIVERFQPYRGEGPPEKHLLTALHLLDVSDKHRVLAAGVAATGCW